MDDLERELRDVLTSARRALPASLVPLERVHSGAARRRRRRAAAVATAAGVAVLALAGTAAAVGGLHRGVPAPPAGQASPTHDRVTGTSTGPAPTPSLVAPAWGSARVASVTATSTRTFVVLGELGDTGRCTPPDCVRLVESHDGGRTFAPLPVPDGARGDGVDGPARDSATSVRFGSAQDGWLFGGGLWSTHDGGHSWSRLTMPGQVPRLEAAARHAWALVADGGDGQTLHLYRSEVGADAWSKVPDVVVTGPADLAVQGDRVVVLGAERSRLWVGGAAGFTERPSPCAGSLATELSAAGSIWATCVTGMSATLATSSDGVTWSPVTPRTQAGAPPNSIAVGARTAGEAVVGLGSAGPLARLTAEGTVTPVTSPSGPAGVASYIGFTTPQLGYAVVGSDLWRTEDGGSTWRRLPLG